MYKANISYARNHLSEILARVREGESILIMDRQHPVARLEPVDHRLAEEGGPRGDLVRRGLLRPGKMTLDLKQLAEIPAPEPACGSDVLQALLEDRDEGGKE